MNANEISSKPNSRLKRLQKIIRVVQVLLFLAAMIVMGILSVFLADFIWGVKLPRWVVSIPLSPHTAYLPPFNKIPTTVLLLGVVRAGIFFAGIFTLNQLLRSYNSGIFFTARNVSLLKRIGCLMIGDWMVMKFLDWIALRVVFAAELGELALGLLIILIAWIMDEGRKIQEEQELTV